MIDRNLKLVGLLEGVKQAEGVYLFSGLQFHACQDVNSRSFRRLLDCLDVFGGVVVGDSEDPDAFLLGGLDDEWREHFDLSTWRENGVNMQFRAVNLHDGYYSPFTPRCHNWPTTE